MSEKGKPSGVEFQSQFSILPHRMSVVPGFRPPEVAQENRVRQPQVCSREDQNEYRSAGVLLQALAAEARAWSQQLPVNFRPAIVAVLHGGVQVQVRTLSQVSFDGIRIEGTMGADIPCSMLAHQDTIQVVCYAVELDTEADEAEKFKRNPIGFIWADHNEEI